MCRAVTPTAPRPQTRGSRGPTRASSSWPASRRACRWWPACWRASSGALPPLPARSAKPRSLERLRANAEAGWRAARLAQVRCPWHLRDSTGPQAHHSAQSRASILGGGADGGRSAGTLPQARCPPLPARSARTQSLKRLRASAEDGWRACSGALSLAPARQFRSQIHNSAQSRASIQEGCRWWPECWDASSGALPLAHARHSGVQDPSLVTASDQCRQWPACWQAVAAAFLWCLHDSARGKLQSISGLAGVQTVAGMLAG